MRSWRTANAHCPTCHGRGEAILDEKMTREGCWVSFGTCHCVEYHFDDEMKAFLRRFALSSPSSEPAS